MKYELGREKALLELLEEQDHGSGVDFSDHAYLNRHNYSSEQREKYLANHDLDANSRYHLERMAENGFVNPSVETPEWSTYSLTLLGHDRLEVHRKNTLIRKAARVIGGWIDKAMTSVFLPILVSVLTVLIMNYFGLNEAKK
ncbi:hypothetical protein KBY25_18610 [Ruegeria pomeroyi]|nr:hypothetical protein [Ruegeria pomeroyi]